MPEPAGIHVRAVRLGALAIGAAIACAVLGAWLLLRHLGSAANTPPHGIDTPPPRLQTAPVPERAAYFAEKERLLTGYGWSDRGAGIARIPLDEAMRLQAEKAGREPGR